jgi:hypothetical protein
VIAAKKTALAMNPFLEARHKNIPVIQELQKARRAKYFIELD